MFEMKYKADGTPIKDVATENQIAAAAAEQRAQEEADRQESSEPVSQGVPDETADQEEPQEYESAPEPEPIRSVFVEDDSEAKKSFREIREAKKKAERERDEYMRRLEELEARQKAATPVEEELELGADDLAEGKHLSKVDRRAQTKIKELEQRIAKYETRTEEQRAEAQLRAKYPDFDKVVSRDNIELLTEAYPELARSIYSTNDLYTKAVSAYTLIKKFGIHQESPFASEKMVAQKNTSKPRPLTSVSPQQGEGALTRANAFASGLTDDVKAQMLREMNDARKGY